MPSMPSTETATVTAPFVSAASPNSRLVKTVDGKEVDLTQLSLVELQTMQWDQEPLFARAILDAPKDSQQRTETTAQAYSTICSILDEINKREDPESQFAMGMDARYTDLILGLLENQQRAGREGALFEVGYSGGVLLEQVARNGHTVGGLEVVEELRQQAMTRLDAIHHAKLIVGDFRSVDLRDHVGKYSIVYWNDVMEHIAPDEIREYLETIKSLLCPGGILVTITPNWHMRPSDVTAGFLPPRSEAIGFHLKEYTVREITELTKSVGFETLRVPAFISKSKIYDSPMLSFTRLKTIAEPMLEKLPFKLAVQCCRRFGMNCTIAQLP